MAARRMLAAWLAWATLATAWCAAAADADAAIEVVGIDVVPHRFSAELRWRRAPQPELGALVRLFVRNVSMPEAAVVPQPLFGGRRGSDLVEEGEWAWCDLPDDRPEGDRGRPLSPGHLDVWTFNAVRASWGPGAVLDLDVDATRPGIGPVRHRLAVPLEIPRVACARLLMHDADGDGDADSCTAHVTNDTDDPVTIRGLRVWSPGADGQAIHDLAPGPLLDLATNLPADRVVPPHDRGVVVAPLGRLPRAHGAIEITWEGPEGRSGSCWASRRFKNDAFAIGSGWLDIPSAPGVTPLMQASFLRLLRRMHVDTTHVGELPGFTDQTGPDGLFTRYPLTLMSGFEDVARYSQPEWSRRIHGVDILGEPQMDKTPAAAHAVLRRYDHATYPTTVTLSEEQGFRFFAGLSDYPHFDAYRVNAPAADRWSLYDRWGGERLRWGAPLEGIGEMTRTLGALSRPTPIAAWSQNVHEGWDSFAGRARRSPTVDEIRIQAYEALANGITALYWYSLQSWSLLAFRDAITETTRIGREIRLLQPIYDRADAFHHQRRSVGAMPDWDLNVLVAPDAALLFAIDLAYEPDRERREFRYRGPRELRDSWPLPGYLRSPTAVFRVDADGVHDVEHAVTADGVEVRDNVNRVGVFVVARDPTLRETLERRHADLLAVEAREGPDPGEDDEAFRVLLRDLGYEDVADVGPKDWWRTLLGPRTPPAEQPR